MLKLNNCCQDLKLLSCSELMLLCAGFPVPRSLGSVHLCVSAQPSQSAGSLLIACCGTTSVHSLQHGEDSRAPSVLPATPPPTANRSVAWWLGDYNSGYISQNAAFLRAHGSTVTGVYHCCLGISMASNGTLAPSAVRPLPTSPHPFPMAFHRLNPHFLCHG